MLLETPILLRAAFSFGNALIVPFITFLESLKMS
jgi:hypothetical protein